MNILPQSYINNKTYNNDTGVGVSFVGNQYLYVPGQVVSLGASLNADDCPTQCTTALTKLISSWYSCLPVSGVITSLNYRLGIQTLNFSSFNFISSVLQTSSYNTNYLLQINNDQSFNNMDIAMTENYTITTETTGQVKLIYAKILTGGVGDGEIAQTVIQNPVVFENPLGKLDRLRFKIYYDDQNITPAWIVVPFDVGFNEWDATFQIDEEVAYADRNSGFSGNIPTIPIPDSPSGFQYMALTTSNNPNNK